MVLMDFLFNAPWPPLGLAVAALPVLVIERSRRKTYESILSTAPGGTLLVDQPRRGRVLLIARAPESRLGKGEPAWVEKDACRR